MYLLCVRTRYLYCWYRYLIWLFAFKAISNVSSIQFRVNNIVPIVWFCTEINLKLITVWILLGVWFSTHIFLILSFLRVLFKININQTKRIEMKIFQTPFDMRCFWHIYVQKLHLFSLGIILFLDDLMQVRTKSALITVFYSFNRIYLFQIVDTS